MSSVDYTTFLDRKARRAPTVGIDVDAGAVNPMLHDWQRDSVLWALHKGRCALFWDCGLRPGAVGQFINDGETQTDLPELRSAVREVRIADHRQADVLLTEVLGGGQEERLLVGLRAVRFIVLPAVRRARPRRPAASVLLASVLHGAPRRASGRHVSEGRTGPPTSACGRARAWPQLTAGRDRPSHRRGQGQRGSEQPRRVPGSGHPRALSLRSDER